MLQFTNSTKNHISKKRLPHSQLYVHMLLYDLSKSNETLTIVSNVISAGPVFAGQNNCNLES